MKPLIIAALLTSALAAPVLADTAATTTAAPAVAPAAAMHAPKVLEYLDPAEFAPQRLLPAPPARGSAAEARELVSLHALIASASTDRLVQAKWDATHEDPAIFNAVMGRDLATLPQTWALLKLIQREANTAAGMGKKYFNRTRPWGVDATIPNCEAPTTKQPIDSYPSGHATLGFSVGYALAQLQPDKAAALFARATDYAQSREYCGVHFASDTEASHVIGTLAAVHLLNDPRLASQVAAARVELGQH
jgi:acid phosphatase (class A)